MRHGRAEAPTVRWGKPFMYFATGGLIPGFSIHVNLGNIVKGKPIIDVQSTFLHNAVKAAGRAIGAASHALDQVTGKISNAIDKIPVVGPVLHAALQIDSAPFRIAEDIGRGQRIDKAVLDGVKRTASGVKEIAPYVQTVVSLVPGIGAPVSAAIGGGLALAEGESIGEAALTAAADALPGGPIAKAGFDAGRAAMEHKNIGQVGLAALGDLGQAAGVPIPPQASQALGYGLTFAKDLADGKKIPQAAIDTAISALPPDAQPAARAAATTADAIAKKKSIADVLIQQGQALIPNLSPDARKALGDGLSVGMAMAHGQNLQEITRQALSDPQNLQHVLQVGQQAISNDPVLQSARATLSQVGQDFQGFELGAGMMQHKITPYEFQAVRNGLRPEQKRGFDLATAVHIGRVAGPRAPKTVTDPTAKVAYYATHGMNGAPPSHRAHIMNIVSSSPAGEAGALAAARELQASGVPTPDEQRGIAPKPAPPMASRPALPAPAGRPRPAPPVLAARPAPPRPPAPAPPPVATAGVPTSGCGCASCETARAVMAGCQCPSCRAMRQPW